MKRAFAIVTTLAYLGGNSVVGNAQSAPDPDGRARVYADSLFVSGAFTGAADEYQKMLKRNPADDLAWYRLGVSLERLTRRDDAIAAFNHATSSPNFGMRAELGLARIWTQLGRPDSAMNHVRRVAHLGIDPAMLDQLPALAPLHERDDYKSVLLAATETRYPCRNVHTFDFWAGDFDAIPGIAGDAPSGGQLHNTREYDGCVLIERWMPANALSPAGMSFAYYDADRHNWRFIWNDNSNGSVQFEGQFREGAMRFEGAGLAPDGSHMLFRNVLQPLAADTIRHTFSLSSDNGATWLVQQDERFVRRKQ